MPDRQAHPLYDRRFEHDACGVGFVADAGGRSRRRVLPLALAGLGSLGHRGAFAADGASSDGAGVLLPLEPSVLGLVAPGVAGRPGVVSLFLPRAAHGRRDRPRRSSRPRWPRSGCRRRAGGRSRSTRPRSEREAAASRAGHRPGHRRAPGRAVGRPVRAPARPRPSADGGRGARGPARPWPRSPSRRPRAGRSSTRASSPASGSPSSSPTSPPDLAAQPRDLPPALRDEHPPRVAARPAVPVDRPQRRDQHDPDEPRAGPRPDGRSARRPGLRRAPAASRPGRSCRPTARTPCRSTRRSSCSSRPAGASRPHSSRSSPKRRALRSTGHPLAGAFARRTAGFLAPWDGPAALVFGDGRRVGALVDRNGLRPLAFAVTRDRLVAAASEAGAVPIEPAETVRRGRLGPGELLLVDPRRGAILEDVEAKTEILRRSWRPDAPRSRVRRFRGPRVGRATPDPRAAAPTVGGDRRADARHARPPSRRARRRARQARHPDDGRRGQGAALEHGRRHAHAGPGADRPAGHRPPPPGVRPGDQPADRPRARARGHGPPRRARPATGAARRDPDRAADRAARPPGRSPTSTG